MLGVSGEVDARAVQDFCRLQADGVLCLLVVAEPEPSYGFNFLAFLVPSLQFDILFAKAKTGQFLQAPISKRGSGRRWTPLSGASANAVRRFGARFRCQL